MIPNYSQCEILYGFCCPDATICSFLFKNQMKDFLYIGEYLLIGVTLRIASLDCWYMGIIAIVVLFNDNTKTGHDS